MPWPQPRFPPTRGFFLASLALLYNFIVFTLIQLLLMTYGLSLILNGLIRRGALGVVLVLLEFLFIAKR